jgi:SAM-dependent methyltransferase
VTGVMDLGRSYGDKEESYAAFRPDYPAEAVALISRRLGSGRSLDIADVGSGTGIFSAQLLEAGHRVYAVEPELRMRRGAERVLSMRAGFVSVEGSAEATGLPDASIDLVTAAQSLHWFDPLRSRPEFARILRPGGGVAALWNERRRGGTPFLSGLDALLRAMQADIVGERSYYDVLAATVVARFFEGSPYDCASVRHQHRLDRQRFVGRVMSSSFAPVASHGRHAHWRAALGALFERHAQDGGVLMEYDTVVVYGVLD